MVLAELLLAAVLAPGVDAGGLQDCELQYNRILALSREVDVPLPARLPRLEQAFHEAFSAGAGQADVQPSCHRFEFRAALLLDFYAQDETYLPRVVEALRRLEQSEGDTNADHDAYLRALVGRRRFDEARVVQARHPGVGDGVQLPMVVETSSMGGEFAALVPLETSTLEVRSLKERISSPEPTVLVIAHPLCGFSNRAMKAIASDAGLAERLDRFVWLAPVDQRLYLDVLLEWNTNNPGQPLQIATHKASWEFVTDWSTPNFYLIEGGQVMAQLTGWPDARHIGTLKTFLSTSPPRRQQKNAGTGPASP